MFRFIIILLLLVSFNNCQVAGNRIDESIKEHYISQNIPFTIKDDKIRVLELPDSLRYGSMKEGKVVMNYFLSNGGVSEGINIKLIRLYDANNNRIFNYHNKSLSFIPFNQYPKEVKKYHAFFMKYAQKQKVEQIDTLQNKGKYVISLPRGLK